MVALTNGFRSNTKEKIVGQSISRDTGILTVLVLFLVENQLLSLLHNNNLMVMLLPRATHQL